MTTDQHHFKAFLVEEKEGVFAGKISEQSASDLPDNDLLIRVHYSSLNYKDALSASGNRGVTRAYPHTPGIDAAGIVEQSGSSKFSPGDRVIVTGYDLGMNTAGGFGQYIRVPSDWVLKLPDGLSMRESMIYGTAGFTAAMSVFRLSERVDPKDGTVVVSGSTGGVGAMSISILARLGYTVAAITGKEEVSDYLNGLGAGKVILRAEFMEEDPRPLLKGIFAGGIDTVGGAILENMIKSTQSMGVVTCCGNVASPRLNLTVYPFILRGVSLVGIDSQNCPMKFREVIWKKLAADWRPDNLQHIYKEISIAELSDHLGLMLAGKSRGRVILNLE